MQKNIKIIIEYFLYHVNVSVENFRNLSVIGGNMFDKIVKLCEKQSISIFVLEEKLGFGKCTILKWKKSSPTVNKLKKVADYFGVSVDYFLEDSVDKME